MTESAIVAISISGSTITRASGNFTTDGFIVGDLIRIIASTNNTGTYTVSEVGTTTMVVTQPLTTEGSFSGAVINYVLFNTESISSSSQAPQTRGMSYHVFLDFGARADDDLGSQSPITNRIGLLAESFNVQTNKSRPTFAIPGTALVTGESKTLSIDLASATKTFNITGIITEQLMVRKYPAGGKLDENNPLAASGEYPGKDGSEVARILTAQEIAQLLHSSLDSSFLQPYQNITNMAVLIPSRVGYDYNYHTGVDENTPVEYLPLIPYSFKARYQDNLRAVTLDNSQYFTPSHSSSIVSHPVVIQSITTDFVPGQPWLTFTINGEFIFDVMGSAKDIFGEDA
tara:strand:- start:5568 stop:6599 length:1032 start_codon:yes stop_codon:yes gene_type:complete